MELFDVHIHLPAYKSGTEVVEEAAAAGTRLISCTVNASEVSENLRLRDGRPGVVSCFLGVHPSDATYDLPSVSMSSVFPRADGVGEIGLDRKYSDTSKGSAQLKTFLDQLGVAEQLGKPVEVHSRGSERECLDALSTFKLKSVLMHWFEGEEHLQEVAGRGYFVSFGPALLYSKKVRRMASRLPGEVVLTESDGPVAFGALGGSSGPALIPSVLFCLSELRGKAFEEQGLEVGANTRRFLGWSGW